MLTKFYNQPDSSEMSICVNKSDYSEGFSKFLSISGTVRHEISFQGEKMLGIGTFLGIFDRPLWLK